MSSQKTKFSRKAAGSSRSSFKVLLRLACKSLKNARGKVSNLELLVRDDRQEGRYWLDRHEFDSRILAQADRVRVLLDPQKTMVSVTVVDLDQFFVNQEGKSPDEIITDAHAVLLRLRSTSAQKELEYRKQLEQQIEDL